MGRNGLYSNRHDTLPHFENQYAHSVYPRKITFMSRSSANLARHFPFCYPGRGTCQNQGATAHRKKRGAPIEMSRQTKQQATLQHLRSLANQPDEQARYALEILERERGTQVASEALAALTQSPVLQRRPLLLRLYAFYDEAGLKRDAGGSLLIAILGTLLPIANPGDRVLPRLAVETYEFLPPNREECAGGLRAAEVVLLSQLDPVLRELPLCPSAP